MSPNYSKKYSNNARCEWLITAELGTRIHLNVLDFATEPAYDRLKIFDGQNKGANLIETLQGNYEYQFSITSTRNALFLEFTSDSDGVERGFLINYLIEKGK